jgi:phosphoenolpyruvate phosphomutase
MRDLVVVRGWHKESVNLPGATYVDNDAYATTGELGSLAAAAQQLEGPCVISYGDVVFRRYVLDELLDAEGDFVVAVDSLPAGEAPERYRADWAVCSEPHSRRSVLGTVALKDVVTDPTTPGITGEWMGLLKVSAEGARVARAMLADNPALVKSPVPELLRRVAAAGHTVRVLYSRGGWLDVDTLADVLRGTSWK